jgi:hypothetical protein
LLKKAKLNERILWLNDNKQFLIQKKIFCVLKMPFDSGGFIIYSGGFAFF